MANVKNCCDFVTVVFVTVFEHKTCDKHMAVFHHSMWVHLSRDLSHVFTATGGAQLRGTSKHVSAQMGNVSLNSLLSVG